MAHVKATQAPAAAPAAPASTLPAASAPADFTADVRLLYRVVACGGDEPLPPTLDASSVDEYCQWLVPRLSAYEKTYLGKFSGPFLAARTQVAQEFKKMWASQPYRELTFRYGYPDASGQHHLLITRPKARDAPREEGKGRRPGRELSASPAAARRHDKPHAGRYP